MGVAATRSAIEGSSFGRNLIAAIPDIIGQALGSAAGKAINSGIAHDGFAAAQAFNEQTANETLSIAADAIASTNAGIEGSAGQAAANNAQASGNSALTSAAQTTGDAAQGALSNGGSAQSGDGVYDGNEIVVTGRRSDGFILDPIGKFRGAKDVNHVSRADFFKAVNKDIPQELIPDFINSFAKRQFGDIKDSELRAQVVLEEGLNFARALRSDDIGRRLAINILGSGAAGEFGGELIALQQIISQADDRIDQIGRDGVYNAIGEIGAAGLSVAGIVFTPAGAFEAALDYKAGNISAAAALLSIIPGTKFGGKLASLISLGGGRTVDSIDIVLDATKGSRANLSENQREVLIDTVNGTRSLSEAKGLVFATREANRLGFDTIRGPLTFGSNNGIDLLVQNGKSGRFALIEAKGGFSQKSLSSLATDRRGITQGSELFNETRLTRFIQRGNNPALGREVRDQFRAGQVDSFATFFGSKRTFQLPQNGNIIRPAIQR